MRQLDYLPLDTCPHCSSAKPVLAILKRERLLDNRNSTERLRHWAIYSCSVCGGAILVEADAQAGSVFAIYPEVKTFSADIPSRALEYLKQAKASLSSPAASIMVCASSVDSMLKEKGLTTGTLNSRIDKAVSDGLLTVDMGKWAHQIRLDANDQRHADDVAGLPTSKDAEQLIAFAAALAEILFVLPKRVTRGVEATTTLPAPIKA